MTDSLDFSSLHDQCPDRRAALSALLDRAMANEDDRAWLRGWAIAAMGEGRL